MRFTIKSAVAGVASIAVAATVLVASGQTATAYTGTPPWVGTANDIAASKGSLTFYDASGNPVYRGTNLDVLPPFVAASSAKTVSATKTQLVMAFPQSSNGIPATWLQQTLSASSTFSPAPAGTPAAINQANAFHKVNLGASPTPVADALGNNATPDTTTGYAKTYELRMQDSGVGATPDGKYWRVVIEYNDTAAALSDGLAAGAWQVVYPVPPAPTQTATTVTTPVATPVTPVASGTPITLSATASETNTPANHPAGTIQFKDGAANVGTAIAVSGAGVATSPSFTPADGPHSFTAVFAPTNTTTFSGATSATPLSFTVNGAAASATTTAITSLAPAATADSNTPVVVTAHVTNAVTAATIPTGTVAIKESLVTYGSATVDALGNAVITIPASVLSIGAHTFTAAFTHSGNFGDSTSAPSSSYAVTLAVPANVALPTISGGRVGVASTCSAGTWTYAGTYSYAWFLDASVTPFATTMTSGVLPASYVNHLVSCVVTAKNPGGQASASSAKAKVAAGAASRNTVRPKIVGSLAVGRVLVASRGTWVPAATTYLYVWKRGAVIVSKTAKYKTTARDKGKTLVVYVYAVRAGYVTGAAVSVAVRIK